MGGENWSMVDFKFELIYMQNAYSCYLKKNTSKFIFSEPAFNTIRLLPNYIEQDIIETKAY